MRRAAQRHAPPFLPEGAELNLVLQVFGPGPFVGEDGALDAPGLAGFLRRLMAEQTAVVTRLTTRCSEAYDALAVAEAFMRGFEGDPLQEGIDAQLAVVRAALPEWARRR